MEKSNRKPHVLAIPMPLQGHIHPLMELSKKLISAGFMVSFANTHPNHQKIQSSPNHEQAREDAGMRLISLGDVLPADLDNTPLERLAAMLSPTMKTSVESVLTRLLEEDPPVSLLVADFRLHFVHKLARKAGIRSLSFWTQTAASFACNLHVAQGFRAPPDDSTLISCVPGVPPFKRSEITGLYMDSLLSLFPSGEYAWEPFKHIHEPTWVVLNTFQELEATTLDALPERLGFRPLAFGPLVNTPAFSLSSAIDSRSHTEEWLRGHPPASVLYIAFGTIITLEEEQLEEIVLGLEASKQPILWAFRPDLCRNSEKYTVDVLSRRLKNQGMIVPWAPQWHVLSHPAVGGFLTHCGWNSTLEGITAGVPMLGWPGLVDQYLNRRCLENQWSIGLGFEADEGNGRLVSRREVQKKVSELMHGDRGKEMREKARSLSSGARRAFENGGSSHWDFAVFLQSFWGSNSKD